MTEAKKLSQTDFTQLLNDIKVEQNDELQMDSDATKTNSVDVDRKDFLRSLLSVGFGDFPAGQLEDEKLIMQQSKETTEHKGDEEVNVVCQYCLKSLHRASYARHRRDNCHGTVPAAGASHSPYVPPFVKFGRRSDVDNTMRVASSVHVANVSQPRQLLSYTTDGPREQMSDDVPTHLLEEAVAGLLEQHETYTVDQLCAYLGSFYPEIPASARWYVVMAATSGARLAAGLFDIYDRNRESPDAAKVRVAQNAASSLASWAFGLRRTTRSGHGFRPTCTTTEIALPPVTHRAAAPSSVEKIELWNHVTVHHPGAAGQIQAEYEGAANCIQQTVPASENMLANPEANTRAGISEMATAGMKRRFPAKRGHGSRSRSRSPHGVGDRCKHLPGPRRTCRDDTSGV